MTTKHDRGRRGRRALIVLLVSLILLGFGLSPGDEAAYRVFAQGVERWQTTPEFRSIALEYCVLGSAACRTRPWGLATGKIVMALRSLPMLPKSIAVNPTSRLHYQNFGRGPLVAYLHLTREQSVGDILGIIESVGSRPDPQDADLRQVLDSFKMDFPVRKDAGALHSVRLLIEETDARRPFVVKDDVAGRLGPHIASIAYALRVNPDPNRMDPAQQQAVLDRLDEQVRVHDPELWRTKQVSDFAGGVWAQVFGPPYNSLLAPFLVVHDVSRILLVAVLIIMIGRLLSDRRKLVEAAVQGGTRPASPSNTGFTAEHAEKRGEAGEKSAI